MAGFQSPFCALAMTVNLDDGGIHHSVFHVWIVGHRVEQAFEHIGFQPIAEALEHRGPLAEQRRQVPPRAASAGDSQHCFHKQPVVTAGSARVGGLAETERLHLLPLHVRQAEPIHGKLLSELESRPTLHGNPDIQQALGFARVRAECHAVFNRENAC